ncbi:FAD/NAD(P)-binding protein [Roseovarius pacificus]|uniref:FAD/NAD(P)-binding protein n=1 Tax=Roseovarius pacificus TaxID=337701 RepID=UPI00403969C2
MRDTGRHHVIIGDGATAAAFAETAPSEAGDRLSVIGPDIGQLGRGLAYGEVPADRPWADAYLLNSPSAAVLPEFADWMAARWDEVTERMRGRQPDWLKFGADHIAAADHAALFAPRAIFGDYLTGLVQAALDRHRASGVAVELIRGRAVTLDRDGAEFVIGLDNGQRIRADRVDLAPGTPALDGLGSDAGPCAFPMLYGHEDEIAAQVQPGRTVLCLGANAAMLDVLRFLQSVLDEGDIRLSVLSASPLRPEPLIWQRPRKPAVAPEIAGSFDTCADLMAAVDAEIARFRTEGADMAQLRPGFKAWMTHETLAALLPDLAERQAVPTLLERRFRRGSHDSIADYRRLRAAGQVTEIMGRAEAVAPATGGASVRVAGQDSLTAPLVINCSGPGTRLAMDDLSTELLRRGWLSLTPDGAGVITGPDLAAGPAGLRYLTPAVMQIGERVMPFPLYDLGVLRAEAARANGA